jgi:DNA-binding GntR family transcriptional regulator
MILQGALLPGAHLRQVELADQLGVSRVPVREALKMLEAEGVVLCHRNVGFRVARFYEPELVDIYTMRRHLETELLLSLRPPGRDVIGELRHLNERFAALGEAGAIHDMLSVNREFHFLIFSLSPRTLIALELRRLWLMSEFYRTLYAYDANVRRRAVREHNVMIRALEKAQLESLVGHTDTHREAALQHVLSIIRRFPPAPTTES